MANIHKGKGKLKGTTIEDIAYKDRNKNQVFMQSTEKGLLLDPSTAAAVASKQKLDELDRKAAMRKAYNDKLTELDELYADLDPLGDFIIRYAVKPVRFTENGITTYEQRMVRGKTRNGHLDDAVPDPFEFQQVAVIVAAPTHEQHLTAGTLMQVVTPEIGIIERQVVGYQNEYVHPTFIDNKVPQSCDNRHFGYAIVSRGWLRVKLPDSYAALVGQ